MLFLAANSRCEGTLSVLMPKTFAPAASNLAIPAWYALNSVVQPPVNAAGKNASTTVFLPLKSESLTRPPWVDGKFNSGATSPTFKCVLGGATVWANRPAEASAPRKRKDKVLIRIPPDENQPTTFPTSRVPPNRAEPRPLAPPGVAFHDVLRGEVFIDLDTESRLIRELNVAVLDDLAIVDDQVAFSCTIAVLEIE